MLTIGSLFSGIGGFDLGLERAGMRTLWFCEQDPFCQRVLARHWPGVPIHSDVCALVGDADRASSDAHATAGASRSATGERGGVGALPVRVPYVDVLCGGFPCQDLSYAGAGAGLTGARSGLWSEYARLIGELGPRYVVVENVAALLARGLGTVLADLAALGYDAEWDCIPASAVGAPHRRDRIWLVAYPGSDDGGSRRARGSSSGGAREPVAIGALQDADAASSGLEGTRVRGRSADVRADVADADRERAHRTGARGAGRDEPAGGHRGRGMGDADRASEDAHAAQGASRHAASEPGWWSVEPDVGRVAHGVPAQVDRLRSLGNALVPQIAEWIGERIIDHEEGRVAA